MVILLDTNVILDFLTVRAGYYENAKDIIQLCAAGQARGYIALHTVSNAFFIMRKVLDKLCSVVKVAGASHDRVRNALMREDFKDFEDCLQDECAKEVQADYIITRNAADFACSDTKAVTPEEFLEKIIKTNNSQ